MGIIFFLIQKIDQILPVFENSSKNSIKQYTRVQLYFRIFFKKVSKSFANNVGRQKSWNDVSRRKFGKNFWIKTQTRTYLYLSYIFSHFFFNFVEKSLEGRWQLQILEKHWYVEISKIRQQEKIIFLKYAKIV